KRLRPSRSARRPNTSAPSTAPPTYNEPAQPTLDALKPSVSLRSSTLPIEPTIVTSRPSSTQATPSAITMRQCQRDQGRRSSRAGMLLYETTDALSWNRPRRASRCPAGPQQQRQLERSAATVGELWRGEDSARL